MLDKHTKLYHKQLRWNVILAVASGILLLLSFPKPGLFPLAWIGLVPFFTAIKNSRTSGSFPIGLIAGFVFFYGLMYWIGLFGMVPCLILSFVQGLFVAVFAVAANILISRSRLGIITVSALWTLLEWIRSLGMFGLTWGGLAYSQAKWTSLVQIASVTGPWGLTFLIVMANLALTAVLLDKDKRSRLYLGAAVIILLILIISGQARINRINSFLHPDKSTAVIQGGVELTWPNPETDRRIYDTYWPMTGSVVKGTDLIIWPESAMPGDYLSNPELRLSISLLARDRGSYLLAGGMHDVPDRKAPGGFREYNGAYLVDPDGKLIGVYNKVHLVPFGEFVPGRNWIPFIDHYPINEIDRYPGKGFYTLEYPGGSLGVMICFESIFPQISRRLVNNGADVLIVITNDSWFKKTAAAAQHHDFSIFRAVETCRYVVRNATTGISSFITPTGEVYISAGLGKKAVLEGKISMLENRTIYTRYGDWFVWLCIAVLTASLVDVYYVKGHPR